MAIRIQLRRDTVANWTTNNPILLPGEIGVETDTLKFKIGNGSRWNATTSYAFKAGEANGLATLGPTGKIPTSQLPDSISMDAELSAALAALTTSSIAEGSNQYFTNQRAIDAVSSLITSAILTETTNRNTAIATAKAQAISAAALDATGKADTARSDAISAASGMAASSFNASTSFTQNAISSETNSRSNAINQAISTEIINRNIAIQSSINALTTSDIEEGSNKYFTDSRALFATASAYESLGSAAAAQSAAIAAAAIDSTTKANAAQSAAIATAATDATTKANAALASANTYTDSLSTSLNNTLVDYVLESDRNQVNGFAGLNSSGKLLDSVIPSSVNAYTDSKVAELVNSAPSTLDTLGELAAALQADESASATLSALVGTKLSSSTAASTYAPLISPTFTGTVSGITKTMVGLGLVDNTSDLSKPISTSQQAAIDTKLNRLVQTNPQPGSYQIIPADAFKLIEMSGGGTLTIVESLSFPVGTTIEVLQTSNSQVTIAGGGFIPDATPGLKLRARWSSATLLKRAEGSWVVMGDLSA
jgi:hypothetical protein